MKISITATKTIIIFAILLLSNHIFACLGASQNRLFPLGMSKDGLCVLETRLFRTEDPKSEPKLIPVWGGIAYLKIYNVNHQEVKSEIIDEFKIFDKKLYLEKIESSLQKAYNIAQKYNGFIAAEPVDFKIIDFKHKGHNININYDLKRNKVNLKINKNLYPINELLNKESIAKNMVSRFTAYTEEELTAKSYKNALLLNSVREFKIGKMTLKIVHLAYGDTRFIPSNNPSEIATIKANFKNKKLDKTIFEEPVIHHGCGFDFFVLS